MASVAGNTTGLFRHRAGRKLRQHFCSKTAEALCRSRTKVTPGTPRFTWHQLCAMYIPQKNHSLWCREGADWEYLTFKLQQPELETVIQHEDLRGCFQQTNFWLHSQFHIQPCKSCQTPAMASHPYPGWSIGKNQPRGWEHIITEVGKKLFSNLLEMLFLISQPLCFPSAVKGSVKCWESPSAT